MEKIYLFLSLLVCLMVTGCSKQVSDEATSEDMVRVNVQVNGFTIDQEDFAPANRATTALTDYSGVKAVTLAFYKSDGTTQQYCTTQLLADNTTYTTFGDFSLELPVGNYKMIALAYGSESPVTFNSMTSVVFGEERSRETFSYTSDITVSNAAAVNLTATLRRIVTRLRVQSTDNYIAEAKKVRFTMTKGGKGFNPITGLATSDAGLVNTFVPQVIDDVTNFNTNFFLTADEETMDVTIETIDASDKVLFTKVVTDVPFKRNRTTVLTGAMYSVPSSASGSFTVESDWESNYDIDF